MGTLYRNVVRPLLFTFDSESIHHTTMACAKVLNNRTLAKCVGKLLHKPDARLAVSALGFKFANPLGLAAGFDKNAECVGLFSAMGFGHIELGTVTSLPQSGNPRPRIFRLKNDAALINRMGFPGKGCEVVRDKLAQLRASGRALPVIGINIGKSKVTEIDNALEDYARSFALLSPYADYVTVNVSSPNTADLRKLQDRDRLEQLLKGIQEVNKGRRPILIKVAPDLSLQQLDEVVEVALSTGMAGIIATNTTLSRAGITTKTEESGGLSGKPLTNRALECVTHLSKQSAGRLTIVGVGGVSTLLDLARMLHSGATLVQLYTALVYQGPGLVGTLNSGLVALLERLKLTSISAIKELQTLELERACNEINVGT